MSIKVRNLDKQMDPYADSTKSTGNSYKHEIVWRNVILFVLLHFASLYSLTTLHKAHPYTLIFAFVCYCMGGLGITAGAHRLWSHKSYKAKAPLRALLTFFNSIAFQNSVYEWCRDHRAHHKYTETDGDPHNANRGLFFSHMGWLLVRKHPDVKKQGKNIDMGDLQRDYMVMFQHRYYLPIVIALCFAVPTVIPLFWGERFMTSYLLSLLRYTTLLHSTWMVNSVAHKWGNRPYDLTIKPAQNLFVSFCALGEGFHNYHHVFPFDYSTSEFGIRLNPTTFFINFMASIGQAYDLKTASKHMVSSRKERTGIKSE